MGTVDESGIRRTHRRPAWRSPRLALPLLVVAAGLAAGVWITASGWHQRALVQPVHGGLTAVGHVVDYKTYRFKGSTYAAIVQYRAADGQSVQITGPYTANRPAIGSAVTVSYLLLDPWHGHDLSVRGWTWQWPFFSGVLLNVLVAAFLAHLVVTLVRFERAERTSGEAEAAALAERARTQVLHANSVFQVVMLAVLAALLIYTAYDSSGRFSTGLIATTVFAGSSTALVLVRGVARRLLRR